MRQTISYFNDRINVFDASKFKSGESSPVSPGMKGKSGIYTSKTLKKNAYHPKTKRSSKEKKESTFPPHNKIVSPFSIRDKAEARIKKDAGATLPQLNSKLTAYMSGSGVTASNQNATIDKNQMNNSENHGLVNNS